MLRLSKTRASSYVSNSFFGKMSVKRRRKVQKLNAKQTSQKQKVSQSKPKQSKSKSKPTSASRRNEMRRSARLQDKRKSEVAVRVSPSMMLCFLINPSFKVQEAYEEADEENIPLLGDNQQVRLALGCLVMLLKSNPVSGSGCFSINHERRSSSTSKLVRRGR